MNPKPDCHFPTDLIMLLRSTKGPKTGNQVLFCNMSHGMHICVVCVFSAIRYWNPPILCFVTVWHVYKCI
jgi:hypothetical protein